MRVCILFFIVCLIGSYCGMSFYYFNFDPGTWHKDSRASMVIIALIVTFWMVAVLRSKTRE